MVGCQFHLGGNGDDGEGAVVNVACEQVRGSRQAPVTEYDPRSPVVLIMRHWSYNRGGRSAHHRQCSMAKHAEELDMLCS